MKRKPRVVVWGAGGHGKVIIDLLLLADDSHVVGFLDDDVGKAGRQVLGVPVLATGQNLRERAAQLSFDAVAIGIGDNYIREEKFRQVCEAGLRPITVIHPTACVSRFAELGKGVVILAGAIVGPGAAIEDNACVNTAASVDHDVRLQKNCQVFPGATLAGGVHVGMYSYVGSGAVVNPNIRIGDYAFVGAGAVVIQDVAEGVTVAGVPARQIGEQPKRPGPRRIA